MTDDDAISSMRAAIELIYKTNAAKKIQRSYRRNGWVLVFT